MHPLFRSNLPLLGVALLLLTALLAVVVGGCATLKSGSYVERTAAFPHYRTWGWAPPQETPTGDPRLDSNPMFEEHLRAAVEHQLSAKGYVRTTLAGPPELRAHYDVNFSKTFEVTGGVPATGSCYGNCEPEAYAYEQGTIVVDLVDVRTNELAWRGWVRDTMEGRIDDQRRLEQEIDIAVAALFEACPNAVWP